MKKYSLWYYFPQGPKIGDFIDSLPIPSLASGQETVVKFLWNVPDTTGYTGYDGNTGCLTSAYSLA